MILHELFFEALNPAPAAPVANGKFAKAVGQCFGSMKSWKDYPRDLAETRGVGRVVCACDRESNRLINVWIDLHHLGLPARARPVLVLDLWEHAWLTDFKPSQRKDYVE
ncbi:MAG: Fe-Mn family superoxide dismutase [Steroidobacteraceae bacterium]